MRTIALAMLLAVACEKDPPPPLPSTPNAVAPMAMPALTLEPEARPTGCYLAIGNTQLNPLLFPTIEGAAEFDGVLTNGADATEANLVIIRQRGISVPRLTKCNLIFRRSENQLDYAEVRLTEGAHAGQTGWLPASQVKGL